VTAVPPSSIPSTPGRWSPTPFIRLSVALHVLMLPALLLWPRHWPWIVGVIVADHLLMAVAGMWPRSRLNGPNLTRLPPAAAARGEIALSFDDGPDPAVTPQVLDLLDTHGAKATFFCTGKAARAQPALLREIVRRGHAIGNHSDRHSNFFAFYGYRGFRRELAAAQAALTAAAGTVPQAFRAPMGIRNPMLEPALAHAGLRYVSWTRRGYDAVRGDADGVYARLVSGLAAGDILLLHDGHAARGSDGRPVVLTVLPRLLARIAELRLRPVTLPAALGNR
jgi:peptidoglycan/xylan/chitin deacetylase (PgdA/CDA1 family)